MNLTSLITGAKALFSSTANLKAVALLLVSGLIQHAETAIPGNGTGASKKAWVLTEVDAIVTKAFPGFLCGIIQAIVNNYVPSLIDSLVAKAAAEGVDLLGNAPSTT
jgi:hypothetical protein